MTTARKGREWMGRERGFRQIQIFFVSLVHFFLCKEGRDGFQISLFLGGRHI